MRRAAFAVLGSLFVFASGAGAAEKIRVLVPDRDNLQYTSFWVAKAGGHFAREGIDVEVVTPPGPQQTGVWFAKHDVDAAVLPPPVYLQLVAQREPVVLVANLLMNDPIVLVVQKEIAESRKIVPTMTLKERLVALRGLKLGIAPHPPTRLKILYASQGLEADKELTIVTLHGKEQNAAFAKKEVDALYAHTPYLEQALVKDHAVIVVDQARGEVPELANRQIHGLAFLRTHVEKRPDLVERAVRAIAAAEASVHASESATVDVLAKAFPSRDRKELETIVHLYEPAVPRTPRVRVEDAASGLAFFPAGTPKPDLTGIDWSTYLAPSFAEPKKEPTSRAWTVVAVVATIVIVFAVVASLRGRKPKAVKAR